ncbi:glycosyltransferase family 4 protein [Sphingomonas solaris]|uniref:Glycosyltransferase family 4 protein n=1 Tax=Alterirhizorhabdus solaris TaxID=2529389 RepID=A0A558QZR7_9SPHN|nr:glycosyltransferase [Sphingomonas solaris]TVV72636.1 glycosyltransferase family 4 protein [Sphingomonas solaris]
MRIVIDLQSCQNGSRTRGIGRAAMALTRAMIAAGRDHDYIVLLSDRFPGTILPIRRALADLLPAEKIAVCALPSRTASADPNNAWRNRAAEIMLADFVAVLAPDLLFIPSLFEGFWDEMVTAVAPASYRTAVLLYDFIPLDHADIYLPGVGIRTAYYRKMRAAAAADLLLADSHHVAGEAVVKLSVPADRLVAMPLGVDPGFRPPQPGADHAGLMARYGITRPFVLNTSPFEPRKNIGGLIAGFAAMPATLRDAHQIVLVGRVKDAARQAIAALAAGAGLPTDTVVLAGFVPDEDLVALYGACALFAFPSLGEGFGLPVLEAMACGASVIGSNTTSIPEVIGRDDLLCDPTDPAAIGTAMARVLNDAGLRRELAAWGPARAALFSWEATAATALDAFERTCADPLPARPALADASPASARPHLALICDDSGAALAEPLLRALDTDFVVTAVVPGGALADPWTAANFDAHDFGWFERHAPRFDHILYVAAFSAAPVADLIAEFPGVLLLVDRPGDAPESSRLRDLFATGGFAAILDAQERPARPAPRGATLLRHTTGSVIEGVGDFPSPGASKHIAAAAVARLVTTIRRSVPTTPDPRRVLAQALPRAVRETRPTADDLAEVAKAAARNDALRRAPMTLVDVSALADGMPTPARQAALRALLKIGNKQLHYVSVTGSMLVIADRLIAGALGITPDVFAETAFFIRPGDRLIRTVDFGDGSGAASPASTAAEEAGAKILTLAGPALVRFLADPTIIAGPLAIPD